MRSIFGWTPGLHAFARGELLPCGCLTGTYTTWRRHAVVVIDERGPRCTLEGHHNGAVIGD